MQFLDYSITSLEKRKEIVNSILKTENYNLESLATYLISPKLEKQEKLILTDSRESTINKHETSYEGLVSKLEGGEDTLYHMEAHNKNIILHPKKVLNKKEIESDKFTKQIYESAQSLKEWIKEREVSELQKRMLKKAVIELYKDMYTAWSSAHPIVNMTQCYHSNAAISLEGISFADPSVVEALLCNYNVLRGSRGRIAADLWYIYMDFAALLDRALIGRPIYRKIANLKIEGLSNEEVQVRLRTEDNVGYTKEYISTLWRSKLPIIIADTARKEYTEWLLTYKVKAKVKQCTCCGEIKLATTDCFSKDKSKKDGLYTICKECRKKKNKK